MSKRDWGQILLASVGIALLLVSVGWLPVFGVMFLMGAHNVDKHF